ncbi:unnamed protein product [Orchesella dallaii]|uniref:HTTM-like domain-containing protein n=1 Tax=Orchesella dallaii TaxID=48710 RepID=A0ABP1QPT0_9HEXA
MHVLGFLMALDVFQERGLSDADIRFGDPNYCFFPLFEWIQPLPTQQACILYSIMWAGSIGIMLGLKFRLSCLLYLCPYVYFFLLDKSRWNNHSYLFGLFAMLLTWSGAGHHMSIDTLNLPAKNKLSGVPKWNYLILKFQISLLYFFAGVKKLFDSDWVNGYSMKNLSKHSLFSPLKMVTDAETIEFYMVHMGGLVYDLTVGFMLNFDFSKKAAYLLSLMFHGLNSQIFHIGMFPYVCLASLVLFCKPHEFPCSLFKSKLDQKSRNNSSDKLQRTQQHGSSIPRNSCSSRVTTGFLLFYILLQIVLPFSHSITQGYNTWTKGLYGYSWDMMINSWETLHQKITVRNYETGDERYLDPDVWVTNDRWSSHPDMARQYAGCISRNLARFNITNIEIYMDVWKSLNGRFQQRMYDPRVNILTAPWSPFEEVTWVLPLLRQFSHYRQDHFQRIAKEVSNWTESSDVIFVADFPGLYLENYLPKELGNVSITILSGQIMIEQDGDPNITLSTIRMSAGNEATTGDDGSNTSNGDVLISTKHGIRSAEFHKVHVVSFPNPSCYMYTYTNDTAEKLKRTKGSEYEGDGENSIISQIWNEIKGFTLEKYQEFATSIYLVANAHLNLFFDVPMVIRKSINSPD